MLDILLLILLGVGFVGGLFSGAVRQVISLVAFLGGYVAACVYSERLGELMAGVISSPSLRRVCAFVLIWLAVPLVAKLVASLLTSLLDSLVVTGLLNRLLGGVLGAMKYGLVLGAMIWFFSSAGFLKEESLQQSRLAAPLKALPEFLYQHLTP